MNPGDHFNGPGTLQWIDTTRDGAEEYVKGYVSYFRELGAALLRVDFLAWYENGYDQSGSTTRRRARPRLLPAGAASGCRTRAGRHAVEPR